MFESCGPLASDFAGGFPNETQNRSIRSAKPAQERELRLSFGRLYLQIISAFCRPRQHNGDLLRPVGARNRPRRWELDRGHRPLDAGLVGARARLVSTPKPKSRRLLTTAEIMKASTILRKSRATFLRGRRFFVSCWATPVPEFPAF
jgi:hypothetical protein